MPISVLPPSQPTLEGDEPQGCRWRKERGSHGGFHRGRSLPGALGHHHQAEGENHPVYPPLEGRLGHPAHEALAQ